MDIFSGVLITSLYATVVGLVIILIKGILKNKLNAKWHYLIWYVFILKLILPFGPESAVSLFNAMPKMPQQSMTEMAYQIEQQYQASLGAENPLYGPPTQRQVRAAKVAAFGESLLPYIWVAGAGLMLMWLVFAYYSLHRKLSKGSFAADKRLLYILEACKAKMGIRRNVSLVLQDTVGTPSLFGILRPRILLITAVADLSDKEIEYILLHELAHLKRKDVPVNYLLTVLQIIHWFNPVLWHCFKSIRQDMEVATDELVLSVLGSTEHRDYGRAILTVLESFSEFSLAPRLLGMVDDRKNIENRLKMIKMADFFRRRRIAALATGLLCVTVLGGVLLTNGLANNNSPQGSATAYSAEALFKYRTAYVGDNSKVVNLINNLPYAHLRGEVSLHTENPPYGITVNYDFSNTDTDIRQIERTLSSNAVVMFALIDNVDAITFKVRGTDGQPEYQYSRAEVQKNFDSLREYAKDIEGLKLLLKKLNFTLLVFPGKYAATMSITPGIRILAEYKGPVWKVRYSAEKGVLLTWDAATGNISKNVQKIDLPQGIPVYWSPLGQNGQISEDRSSIVTVELLDEKGKEIDERQLTIIYDGSLFYTVNSSPGIVVGAETLSTAQGPRNIDDAVSIAIKSRKTAYGPGETATEGHIILDTGERGGSVIVYTIASFGAFGFENGVFTKVSGSGAIPTVMIFSQNIEGEYSLLEYREPEDGARHINSVKSMFPAILQDKVFSAHNYYSDLAKQQEAQAAEYLKSIGRTARVSEAPVEKRLAAINVEASNKLFAEFTKNNTFINNCPYWIGTREQIENGVRYIYETSQGKTGDGCDLIIFSKAKEDKTVIQQYRYKIIGSEPQLID